MLLPLEAGRRLPLDDLSPEELGLFVRMVDRVVAKAGPAAAFDLVLARFASRAGGGGVGQVATAPTLTELMARLVAPESATTIYDPACRAAELLVETARRSRGPAVSLRGNARDLVSLALSEENARVHGMTATMERSDYPWSSAAGYHSRVICNPPFSLSLPDHALPHPSHPKRADFAWLLHAASSLAPQGHAAVLMPRGTLSRQGRERDVRKDLVEDRVVEALVLLPPQLAVDATIPTVVWLLRRFGEARDGRLPRGRERCRLRAGAQRLQTRRNTVGRRWTT